MKECTLCPRNCLCKRTDGELGFCGEKETIRISRAALHFWEEPFISGKEGSGAVFFSGCNLRCIYCQNREIALGRKGKEVSVSRLAEIYLELQAQGANNINLVTGAHFISGIRESLLEAKKSGLIIPVVYNSSGYELPESLTLLEGLVDIYLPDFKYMDKEKAQAYSHAEDYPERAKAALAEMFRQVGEVQTDERGLLRKGMVVRHLLLPLGVGNAKGVVDYVYETYGDKVYFSLMNQFTPCITQEKYTELNRKVTAREYDRLLDYVMEKGITNAFIQVGDTAKESFIPDFDFEGV